MNISLHLKKQIKLKIKKKFVQQLLKTTRPTLNRKVRENDWAEWEIALLIKENIIKPKTQKHHEHQTK